MQEQPLPTPYDILDPAGFAYEPGMFAWAALLICGALLLAWAAGRRPRPAAGPRARQLAREELARIGAALTRAPDRRRLLGAACLVSRRLLSVMEGADLASQTGAELRRLSERLPRLAPVLSAVAETESLRFQPTEPSRDQALRLFAAIELAIDNYIRLTESEETQR